MKQLIKKISFVILASALVAPMALLAQDDKEKEKKDAEQIIITRKGSSDNKVVIELNGDKVLINGKDVKDLKDEDVTVRRNKIKDVMAFSEGFNGFGESWNNNFGMSDDNTEERTILGVTTEENSKGAEIEAVTKESGAEKAGLKKGDIITKVGDERIDGPNDLSTTIRKHKPGDKVVVSYLRDGKEQKVTAELGKWKGVRSNYNIDIPNMNMNLDLPRLRSIPRVQGQNWSWSGGGPKLGLFVQDSEDGKGVKVVDVDDDGNAAKAGVKEDDVITEIDGKAVNSADDASKIIKESKDKVSVKVKLLRQGKSQDIDVKIPRKLKTADL
jgi:serine protease Do